MTYESFAKKYKVAKAYSYHEEDRGDGTIAFGWVKADKVDLSKAVVLSTSSKAKSVSEEDREWAKSEGNSVSSLSDYSLYFKALTSTSPEAFLSKWSSRVEELESYRASSNNSYREGEGDFLLCLADLILNNKKFVRFGRIYKVVNISS